MNRAERADQWTEEQRGKEFYEEPVAVPSDDMISKIETEKNRIYALVKSWSG